MKLKKELIILGIVIFGLSVYLVYQKDDHTQYALPDIPRIAKNQISKLELSKGGTTVTLQRKDNTWHILPQNYPADSELVNPMLSELEGLKLTTLVSESKNYARYDLKGNNRIAVKAWVGGEIRRQLHLGKSAGTYQHTFVKLANDPNVYHCRGDIRYKFDQTLDSLRDKTVLSFNTNQITELTVVTADKKTSVQKSEEAIGKAPSSGEAGPANVWKTADGRLIDTSVLQNFLATLSALKCDSYIKDKHKGDFKDPVFQIFLKGAQEDSLYVFAKADPKATAYPGTSSQNGYPFLVSASRVDSIKSQWEKVWSASEMPAAERR